MYPIHDNTILINKPTTRLQGFRLEDTARAPMIILFVDEEKPQMIPLKPGQTPPTLLKSENMEAAIEIITYAEVHSFMHQEDPHHHHH